MRRMCLALGVDDLDSIGGRIAEMLNLKVPEGLFGKLAMLPEAGGDRQVSAQGEGRPARRARRWSCGATRSTSTRFPFLTTWPGDGGRYITLPMVITTDPARGIRNVGMYRVQVLGRTRSPCTGSGTRSARRTGARWRSSGERMPVVIALGGDPASIYSGSAPLPPTIDEFIFAGFLRREPVELAAGGHLRSRGPGRGGDRARGLHRPGRAAGARGAVRRPHRLLLAGRPLSRGSTSPRVTARRDPIYPATLVGQPADGGLLPGPRHRADLPAAAQAHGARDRGLPHARRRHLPQPGVRRRSTSSIRGRPTR